ncbi:FAD-binding protein [Telmatospirillum sp.]|uniref:FAD-binding protein n=1 Tax=Telmatospirillum sp. TaxID=2079197 RepID=UPI002849FBA4|nr:FAD-binding protein [Telmatospirillum sp.]MDR3439329.1 FAD-binding protein [Telmatospirillum sp.]
MSKIWVFSDMASRYPELLAAAASLGGDVNALVIGTDSAKAFSYGATTVTQLPADESRMIEDYVPTIAKCVTASGTPAVVLISATKRGKAVAAKLGIALNAGVINDASSVKGGDGVTATHMVFGGLAVGTETVKSAVAVITMGSGAFEPLPEDAARKGDVVTADFVPPPVSIKCLERRAKQNSSSVDIGKARRIVSIGRGLKAQEDLAMVRDLASALDAEVGCSRPIAEGENWLERERYVGVTGVQVKADLYVALGISGQIQHMVGANGAKTIFAVNKDKNAPIFQYADFGLVGDIYKVVPAMTALLRK